jgi:hypothetical protein
MESNAPLFLPAALPNWPKMVQELGEPLLDMLPALNGSPVLLTGRAGTGKSTVIRAVYEAASARRRKVAICAPTGRAAVQVGGSTIHRLFGFPLRLIDESDAQKSGRLKVLRHLDMLIVDEVSMVRADVLHAMDRALKLARRSEAPFGGALVLLVGDPGQLPPVVADPHLVEFFQSGNPFRSHHFWGSPRFEEMGCRHRELRVVHRQSHPHFVELLSQIRNDTIEARDMAELGRVMDSVKASREGWTVLCGGRARAERINAERLSELPGAVRTYQGQVTGRVRPEMMPAPLVLETKPGARVMIVQNSPDGGYFNGTTGIVMGLGDASIRVQLDNGSVHDITPHTWTEFEYTYDPAERRIRVQEAGTFQQLPLIPAYALTIHHSQGLTLDRVCIDLNQRIFEHGQFYVAVSRVRTQEGLAFTRPPQLTDNLVDTEAFQFRRLVVDDSG